MLGQFKLRGQTQRASRTTLSPAKGEPYMIAVQLVSPGSQRILEKGAPGRKMELVIQ